MPILEVCLGADKNRFYFEDKKSIKQLLDTTTTNIRSACNGVGACGLCKIKVVSQETLIPSPADELHLSKEELASGIRLACQHFLKQDISIEIIALVPKLQWQSDTIDGYKCKFEIVSGEYYNLAIDIGTTNLGVALCDSKGVFITDRVCVNPQAFAGADVLSRIISAAESYESAKFMWDMVVSTLSDVVADIIKKEDIPNHKMINCSIVGNTAMISMFCRHNYHLLLDPAYWMAPIETNMNEENRAKIASKLNVDSIVIWPSFAGFVGSDVAAGIVHTRLLKHKKPSMLIDFGTNSEIAFWDGKKLWLTSAAGGPAFESSGVGCGMPAGCGAIFRVAKDGEEWSFETLGGVKPEGVCGSGIVDLIAILVGIKEITPIGTFKNPLLKNWKFTIEDMEFFLSKKDIDLFARAKASISVGVVALCEAGGIEISDIDTLYIGGDFGKHLDIKNAMSVGLIPQIATQKVKILGNTALLGCLDLCVSKEAQDEFWEAKSVGSVINLASYKAFDDVYMQNLYLKVMSYAN